jgi:hypothetical protein
MANKKQVLGALSRRHLQQLVSSHELEATDRRSMDGLTQALMAARRIKIEDVLGTLSLVELQGVCEKLGMPSGPRQKAKMIAHIVAAKATSSSGRKSKTGKKAPARQTAKKKVSKRKTAKKTAKKKVAKKATKKKAAKKAVKKTVSKKKAAKKKTTRRKKTTSRVAPVEVERQAAGREPDNVATPEDHSGVE